MINTYELKKVKNIGVFSAIYDIIFRGKIFAVVAKLADALSSGGSAARHVGSSPINRTKFTLFI